MPKRDVGIWECKARLLKYNEDITPFAQEGREAEFHNLFKPYEIIEMEQNSLLNVGCDIMWDLIVGDSTAHFDESNATIGVGEGTAAADGTQTDLQGTSKTYAAMESGYPTSTAQKATFKSSFGGTEANNDWEEWVVKRTVCLNRKVESLGTKASGTWTLECDITLS